MTPTPEVQARIRRYLLGQLADRAREEIEKDLLANDELFEELLVVEDEIIDQYLSGKLDHEERAVFEQHFMATPERQEKLRFGRAFDRYLSSPAATSAVREIKPTGAQWTWTQAFVSSPVRIAAFTIIMVVVALGVWRVVFYQSEVDKGLLALNAAYREQRPLEARISALSYAPFLQTRGPNGAQRVDSLARNRAELTLNNAVDERKDAAAHHALGEVYLAKKQFDDAIKEFDEALKSDPKNAQIYSDLGAAWLEKGKIDRLGAEPGKGLEDFARSLEKLDRALELNANLLEALFNRAIVHQEMALPQQAEDDWKKYLEKDPSSRWADEARQKLVLLEEKKKTSRTREELLQDFLSAYAAGDDERAWQVISRSREALSRKLIWEQLIDGYLEASKQGHRSESGSKLQALSYEGDLESRRANDQYVSGLTHFYQSSSENEQQTLTEARSLMKLGHEFYFQHKLNEATDSYTKARGQFAAIKDEWETRYAQYWIGYCYYEQGKTQESVAILEELARSLQKDHHQWLLMRTLHLLSSGYHNLNEYSKAINYNHQALSLAERISDAIGIFNASSILVFQYSSTGNNQQALAYVQRSLSIMPDCPLNEIQLARHYTILAIAFDSAAFYHAAIDYQKEAIRRAAAIGLMQHVSLDYARLGLMYAKAGDSGEALRNLDLAYTTAQSDADETYRKEMMAFSSLQTGHLYREQGEFKKALKSYDQSIALSDNFHFKYDVYEAHKNRLFCYLALKDDRATEQELNTTLDLAGKYRSTIIEGDNKNSFFDIEQSVYDLAIDYEYSRMLDPQRAFKYSEDSRSRSLLDSVRIHTDIPNKHVPDNSSEPVAESLTLTEIQSRLSLNAQILQYAVLNDKVLIWVISKEKFTAVKIEIGQRELQQRVLDYVRVVEDPTEAPEKIQNAGKEMFEILIKPAENLIDKNKSVYLVPDKFLGFLPFGTLVSPTSGRFLLQDYQVAISPSSNVLVFLSDIARKKVARIDERLLSVGNPRFDHDEFPSLSDLPSASREAEQIAAYYYSKRVLIGADATRQQVSDEMLRSDVVHFAVHAVADERSPMNSRLVLAKDSVAKPPSDGSLHASEIYQMNLSRTRLTVLSACQTGAERYYRGEGMINLARPFLAAGVPMVVVSLWPVDSDVTAELMISFHRHRKQQNLSSAAALRQAQLDLLSRPDERLHHTFAWGAFVLIGGYATY